MLELTNRQWDAREVRNDEFLAPADKEEGAITTAFDMQVQNDLDRSHLVQGVIDRLPDLGSKGAYLKQAMQDNLSEYKHYIDKHGQTCRRSGT